MLLAAEGGLDFTEANLDLAVCFAADKGEHEGLALIGNGFVTVGREGGGAGAIAWPGAPGAEGSVLSVADAGLAIDAAAAGFGRATVPALLAAGDLAAGRVTTFAHSEDARHYWLIAPLPQWRQKKVRALVAALAG